MSSLLCRACNKPIKFDDRRISKSGKRIPLDFYTNAPHDCPAYEGSLRYRSGPSKRSKTDLSLQQSQYVIRPAIEPHLPIPQQQPQQQQQKQGRYHQCNKGCGKEIYFDVNTLRQFGKWIPLSKETGLSHRCHNSIRKLLYYIVTRKIDEKED